MKENTCELYPNEQVANNVSQYAFRHSTPLPQSITDLHEWGLGTERANMMSSPLQAQFEIFIAKLIGAERVLEIGCYVGFSAMAWAHAVGTHGHVTSLEFDPKYAEMATEAWEKHGAKNIEVVIGDARETIKQLVSENRESYDLIFIDADKSSYPTYLELIMSLSQPGTKNRLLRPGGVILADNILRRGLVADNSDANPYADAMKQNKRWTTLDLTELDRFNQMLVNDERIDTFLMPMFDGLGMGRLKD